MGVAHGLHHVRPFHVGQVPVHQQEVEGFLAQRLQQAGAIGEGVAHVLVAFQGALDLLQQEKVVVKDCDAHGDGLWGLTPRWINKTPPQKGAL